nr:cobalamin biosynthesis protein CobU [Clostridiales bacterium]
MDLIIGGAYQGKLDYAKKAFGVSGDEIYTCSEDADINFSLRCVDRIEEYTLWCVRNGADAVERFMTDKEKWKDSILICQDIFCGVVPMGADMRAWRDMTGKLCAYLSSEAESVTRM